jgi:hypothetical protein
MMAPCNDVAIGRWMDGRHGHREREGEDDREEECSGVARRLVVYKTNVFVTSLDQS